jgi:NADH dehydrogenase
MSTRIVIVGGGFAGVRAALNLANDMAFDVKLVSDKHYFEYHAALYRSATGRSPLEVAIPLRDFFAYAKNIEVVKDSISGINPNEHILTSDSGSRYHYDLVILAFGNVTQYFGIKGLKEHAYGVKTIHEALRLKRHLHEQLVEKGQTERNYVVIGGGATGVELAAELAAYLKRLRRRHNLGGVSFNVDLVEAAPRVMPIMSESFSKLVQKRLGKLGVNVYLNAAVKSETVNTLKLPSGEITSHTVIWTAGVANHPFYAQYPTLFEPGRLSRVKVDQYLQAAPGICVVGDSADTKYAGMAQTALYDANFVTNNLKRKVRKKQVVAYKPKKPVYAIPVGKRWAAVYWGKVTIYGRLGWALRRLADLRLYLNFLPFSKALVTWRYGFVDEEVCKTCK